MPCKSQEDIRNIVDESHVHCEFEPHSHIFSDFIYINIFLLIQLFEYNS